MSADFYRFIKINLGDFIMMNLYNVDVRVSDINTGSRYLIQTVVSASHEIDARSVAMTELSFQGFLDEANLLSVDINENTDRFRLISIDPAPPQQVGVTIL
jgi:hypothetical protein